MKWWVWQISHTFPFRSITDILVPNWWNMSFGNFLGICKNLYFSSRNFVYVWFLLEWSYKFSGKNYFKYCINYSYLDIFHSKLWDNISLLKDIYLNFRICCILNKFVSFDDLFFLLILRFIRSSRQFFQKLWRKQNVLSK